MFCPRCGTQNIETTKFCRQCGLPMAQITGYVATGGTGALQQPPSYSAPPPFQFTETAEMLALKQKKIMTILSICIAPIIIAIIGDMLNVDEIAAIPFLLIPLGIAWAVFRYKTQLRLLQEKQLQQFYAQQQHHPMPQQASHHASAPNPIFQPQPNQPQTGQPQLNAPRTNPLAEQSRGSVIEDETRKFPEQRR